MTLNGLVMSLNRTVDASIRPGISFPRLAKAYPPMEGSKTEWVHEKRVGQSINPAGSFICLIGKGHPIVACPELTLVVVNRQSGKPPQEKYSLKRIQLHAIQPKAQSRKPKTDTVSGCLNAAFYFNRGVLTNECLYLK